MSPTFPIEEDNTDRIANGKNAVSGDGSIAAVNQKEFWDAAGISPINGSEQSKADISYCEEQLEFTLKLSLATRADLKCKMRTSKNDVPDSSLIPTSPIA